MGVGEEVLVGMNPTGESGMLDGEDASGCTTIARRLLGWAPAPVHGSTDALRSCTLVTAVELRGTKKLACVFTASTECGVTWVQLAAPETKYPLHMQA